MSSNSALLFGIIFGCSALGLAFAAWLVSWLLKGDTGTPAMREISDAIKSGAEAFLSRQNKTIIALAGALAVVIFLLYAFVRQEHVGVDPAPPMTLAFWTTLSFVLGAACS